MTDLSARENALRDPQAFVGDAWSQQSKTQFGKMNVFNGSMMLYMLGTFWRRWFGDNAQLRSLYDGTGQGEYQSYLYFLETVANLSRFDIPIFSTKNWYYYTVLESEMETASALQYGDDGLVYETKLIPAYGSTGSIDTFAFVAPEKLAEAPSMMNRVIDPSLVLLNNRDYRLMDGKLHFNENPFNNPLVPTRNILDKDGNVVDRQAALWMHLSDWDLEYVYTHFGYVLGVWMESSEYYKDFINALWDNMVLGSTRSAFEASFEAMTGVRFAEGNEVVTFVETFNDRQLVITDKNVYEYKTVSKVIVQEGDELSPGQAIVDTIQIIEPDQTTDWGWFVGMSIGTAMRTGNYNAPVVFQNREVRLTYAGVDASGSAIAIFNISGEPRDVVEFWRTAQVNGVADGRTLANMLDTRAVPTGEPTAKDLPSHINPFEFVLYNLMANNTYIVAARPEGFIDGAPGLSATVHLKRHLPPHTNFIVFICLDPNEDEYNVDENVEDTPSITGGGIRNVDGYSAAVDHGPQFKTVPENCR